MAKISDTGRTHFPLGPQQEEALRELADHGSWSPGNPWKLRTTQNTVKVMDTLVHRGLVYSTGKRVPTYLLSTRGQQMMFPLYDFPVTVTYINPNEQP